MILYALTSGSNVVSSKRFCTLAKVLGLINPEQLPSFWPPIVSRWATGKILFTENQVTLDVIEQPFGICLTSTLIFSLTIWR